MVGDDTIPCASSWNTLICQTYRAYTLFLYVFCVHRMAPEVLGLFLFFNMYIPKLDPASI